MAGSSLIGNLSVLLSMDTAAFERGSTHAQKLMAKTQRQFSQLGDRISGIGQRMSLGITAPFVGLMTQAIPAATQAREAMAQVEAGLASMGGASGKTAEELKKSARELQRMSTFDDDDILRKVTANLITFGNVSGEQFDRAQAAAVNMATRLRMDLQPATIMIGKALNDPVRGLTAMGRAGIQFTDAQKEMIKGMVAAGNAAGAQQIILAELERQFGGSAQAARDAAPGSDTIDAWRDFQETIGEIALNVLPPFTNLLTKVLDKFNELSPTTQKWVVGVAALAAAIGPVLMVLGPLVKAVGVMLPLIIQLAPAIKAVAAGFVIMKTAALAALPALTPFLIPLGLIAAAVGAVYLAWKNWDKIEPILRNLYTAAKTWLVDRLGAIWRRVTEPIETVKNAFKNLYTAVVGNSYIPDMVDGIAAHMARLDQVMVQPARDAAAATAEHFQALATLMDRLFPEATAWNAYRAELATLKRAHDEGRLSAEQYAEALSRLRREGMEGGGISDGLRNAGGIVRFNTWDGILDAASDIEGLSASINRSIERMSGTARRRTGEVIESFANMARDVTGSLRGMVQSFKSGDILGGIMGVLDAVSQIAGMIGGNRQGSVPTFNRGFGGFRARGGPVVPGKGYLVGENGPEWFSPSRSGHIIPSNDNRSGGISLTINAPGATAETVSMIRREMQAAAPVLIKAAKGETLRTLRRPGIG